MKFKNKDNSGFTYETTTFKIVRCKSCNKFVSWRKLASFYKWDEANIIQTLRTLKCYHCSAKF